MKLVGVRSLLILCVVLTIISSTITYLNVQQKKDQMDLVIHAYKVIQGSNSLLLLLKDMEIGHRSYLITVDPTFLQPYHEALKDIDLDLDTLRALVRSPRQVAVLEDKIQPLVTQRRQSLEESLMILKNFGKDSATHFAAMQLAKASMDSIRYWTTDFIQHEQKLLNERSEALEQLYFLNDVVRFASFALIGITSIAALLTIAGKEKDNKRLLQELQQLNLQLEQKVADRTQELVEANKDLVRLNDEKNHFLAITTHDLKAPLAGIAGILEVMKLEHETLSPRHRDYLELMGETCEDMQRLISDLLDLSRIEQGSTHLNNQEISLDKLIHQLEDYFRPWTSRKNISLGFANRIDKPIISDPDLLTRILENLISNALKFSPPGKKVNVSFHTVDSTFRFDIQDEGPGILPQDRSKLFGRFQKLSARPTNGESSTGLGLSIVKDLVTLLDGEIDVKSENGSGACFSVKLPLN